mmetsp:Transcript_22048/g.31668  ORF Transcript_22048/g.31668 Transcript_22048/m.31668 type:complete len:216 (+) Transcript_22048:205-852(+)
MERITKSDRFAIQNADNIQLFSASTPNGIKAAACLEEISLIRQVHDGFTYEPHSVDIRHGESHQQDFKKISPNGKIPAIIDFHGPEGKEVKVFESGCILLYLAEKYDVLIPKEPRQRVETMKWLFWGSSSISVQFKLFGFYYKYCPQGLPYCIARYSKECHRLLSVVENQLQSHGMHWIVGEFYTIADISIWPWVYALHENYGDAITVKYYYLTT